MTGRAYCLYIRSNKEMLDCYWLIGHDDVSSLLLDETLGVFQPQLTPSRGIQHLDAH